MAVAGDAPYFAFEREVTPVAATPTHCRGGCGTELEPLRRAGGLCRACVMARAAVPPPPTDVLLGHMTVVRTFYKQRLGHRERYAELVCDCGVKREIRWSTWVHHKPLSCNRCRLRGIDRNGFEAERPR